MKTHLFSWDSLKQQALAFGLDAIGVTDTDLSNAKPALQRWLNAGHHGTMHYMARHGMKRAEPATLVPGTLRVISVRMNYLSLPQTNTENWQTQAWQTIEKTDQAYISLYARGRDYHKVFKKSLEKFAQTLQGQMNGMQYRVFVDSAPILEVSLAEKAGLGWRGKHTLLINRQAGSMFFLGEILTDYPFEITPSTTAHCGQCRACIDVCPTQAIIAPYWLDARKCISYLTIEHQGAIPIEFRKAIGNRIYGCDDCQLICPWNKFAKTQAHNDFKTREQWQNKTLVALMQWNEEQFLKYTEGSAIRRIGFERWQRNLAVALGNGHASAEAIAVLQTQKKQATALVIEHIDWALARLLN
jgi:epoxyqueuosine reductase